MEQPITPPPPHSPPPTRQTHLRSVITLRGQQGSAERRSKSSHSWKIKEKTLVSLDQTWGGVGGGGQRANHSRCGLHLGQFFSPSLRSEPWTQTCLCPLSLVLFSLSWWKSPVVRPHPPTSVELVITSQQLTFEDRPQTETWTL